MAKYNNVDQFLAGTLDEDAESVIAAKHKVENDCALVDLLVSLRVAKGLTQGELAQAMGVSTSTVSRIEDSRDADIKLGAIMSYLRGLGYNATAMDFMPSRIASKKRGIRTSRRLGRYSTYSAATA